MKISQLLYIPLFVIFSCFTVSCKKYLDKKQDNSLSVPESLEALQSLLDDATLMNSALTPSFGQASTDEYFLLQSTYDTRNEEDKKIYRWLPTDYSFQNDWSRGYTPIYNANYCLDMLPKVPITGQNLSSWNNVKGSALFYRAYNFLMVAWNHCKAYDEATANSDLGIALRLSSDLNVKSVRATAKATYDRIIADAKDAAPLLPDVPVHVYRPSKAAAYGLLARTYLSMRIYDSAFKYADLCLQIKNQLIDCNGDADFLGATAAFPFKQFNKETIFYTEMNFLTVTILTVTRAKVDTTLYQKYSTNDWRKTAFFQPSSGYYYFKGSYSQGGNYFTGIAVDEMYITRAECFARKGNKDAALSDVNLLLSKRWKTGFFVPLTATDAQDALSKILLERSKELLFRGLRWMDIKRYNKESANIIIKRIVDGQTFTLQPNANYYALPLPSDIISITGMPQNPL